MLIEIDEEEYISVVERHLVYDWYTKNSSSPFKLFDKDCKDIKIYIKHHEKYYALACGIILSHEEALERLKILIEENDFITGT